MKPFKITEKLIQVLHDPQQKAVFYIMGVDWPSPAEIIAQEILDDAKQEKK